MSDLKTRVRKLVIDIRNARPSEPNRVSEAAVIALVESERAAPIVRAGGT